MYCVFQVKGLFMADILGTYCPFPLFPERENLYLAEKLHFQSLLKLEVAM